MPQTIDNKLSMKEKVKKGLAKAVLPFVFVGSVLTSGWCVNEERSNYKFLTSKGDYRIVERDNDLYLEKFNGSESRQITHTPDIKEYSVTFSKNGKYVIYSDIVGLKEKLDLWVEDIFMVRNSTHFYYQPIEKDDSYRKEITPSEYYSLKNNE